MAQPLELKLKKVLSGGQQGADKAGLVAALALKLETGGTAPKGWRICNPDGTDGSDPSLAEFGLIEHSSRQYPPRTVQNVKDADGTAWFGFSDSPGGKLTLSTAEKYGKPCIINPTPRRLRQWAIEHGIETLNVAGNRISDQNPHIAVTTYFTILLAFGGYEASQMPVRGEEWEWE